MLNIDRYRIVDLSPRYIGTLRKLNGEILEGNKAPDSGVIWPLEEVQTVNMDDSRFTAVGGFPGDPVFPAKLNAHFGSHTEGGKGHIDHWEGIPDTVKGLWELPLDTFIGPAAVCNFSDLKPHEEGEAVPQEPEQYGFSLQNWRGQAIKPEHLSNVQKGDIVLMYSPYRGNEMPYIPPETSEWLYKKGIKMLAVQMPGVAWDSAPRAPAPHNSPTHRNLLGNNIPITYPLANVETLKKERVFYIGFPLSVERMDASWIRAIALEEI